MFPSPHTLPRAATVRHDHPAAPPRPHTQPRSPALRPLREALAEVNAALEALHAATGRETLGRFFEAAPLTPCVAITRLWAGLLAAGWGPAPLRGMLTPAEQLVLDLVLAAYPPAGALPPGAARAAAALDSFVTAH